MSDAQQLRDPVTGLPTRALLREHLINARARAHAHDDGAVALLSAGLDDFQLVNQSLGYEASEEILRQVARRLGSLALPGDVVARLSDEEFGLMLADLRGA